MLHLENGVHLFFTSEYYDSPLFPVLTSQSLFHLSRCDLEKGSFRFEGKTNVFFFSKKFLNKLRKWNAFLSYYEFFSISGEVKERRIQRLEIFGTQIPDGLEYLTFSPRWGVCSQDIGEVNFFVSRWPYFVSEVPALSLIYSKIGSKDWLSHRFHAMLTPSTLPPRA